MDASAFAVCNPSLRADSSEGALFFESCLNIPGYQVGPLLAALAEGHHFAPKVAFILRSKQRPQLVARYAQAAYFFHDMEYLAPHCSKFQRLLPFIAAAFQPHALGVILTPCVSKRADTSGFPVAIGGESAHFKWCMHSVQAQQDVACPETLLRVVRASMVVCTNAVGVSHAHQADNHGSKSRQSLAAGAGPGGQAPWAFTASACRFGGRDPVKSEGLRRRRRWRVAT